MTVLSARSLSTVGRSIAVPSYDRDRVRTGIVHLGVGGFHRSHQAMYVDRLLNDGLGDGYGICGVGVLPATVG